MQNILRIGQFFLSSVICNILLLHENAHNGAWWGHHTPRRSIYPEHKGKSRDSLFMWFYYCPVNLSSLTLNMGRDC